MRKVISVAISVLGVSLPAAHVLSQGSVPINAQAQRLFEAKCANCHGANLNGGLRGASFTSKWESKPMRALYSRIISTMPMDAPGSLNERQAVALATYIASVNGVSLPENPITSPNELDAIPFASK